MNTGEVHSTRPARRSIIPDEPLLIEDRETGDTIFTGDLEAGKALALQDSYSLVTKRPGGEWLVELGNDLPVDKFVSEWGCAATEEGAWRFALGAAFGPIDEEYDEAALRRELAAMTESTPELDALLREPTIFERETDMNESTTPPATLEYVKAVLRADPEPLIHFAASTVAHLNSVHSWDMDDNFEATEWLVSAVRRTAGLPRPGTEWNPEETRWWALVARDAGYDADLDDYEDEDEED